MTTTTTADANRQADDTTRHLATLPYHNRISLLREMRPDLREDIAGRVPYSHVRATTGKRGRATPSPLKEEG